MNVDFIKGVKGQFKWGLTDRVWVTYSDII